MGKPIKPSKPRTEWERMKDRAVELVKEFRDRELEMVDWYDRKGQPADARKAAQLGQTYGFILRVLEDAVESRFDGEVEDQ